MLEQKDHLKRQLDEKNNIISLLIKTRISYLIKEQNVSNNTKDDVSNENVSSSSNVVIPNSISNNSNYNNNTNITVNKDDVRDITFVNSPHKDLLSISEQLRNIRAEHHPKYLESKRNKDTNTEEPLDTPSYVTPVTQ